MSLGPIALEVKVTSSYALTFTHPQEIELLTHLEINERGWDLFGFSSEDERSMFEKLLSVQGVGPKSALGILSQVASADISHAVRTQSPEYLKQKGLGLKTAEKVVSSLKGKVEMMSDSASPSHNQEVYDALVGLGYKEVEILYALKNVDTTLERDAQIKHALVLLG